MQCDGSDSAAAAGLAHATFLCLVVVALALDFLLPLCCHGATVWTFRLEQRMRVRWCKFPRPPPTNDTPFSALQHALTSGKLGATYIKVTV